ALVVPRKKVNKLSEDMGGYCSPSPSQWRGVRFLPQNRNKCSNICSTFAHDSMLNWLYLCVLETVHSLPGGEPCEPGRGLSPCVMLLSFFSVSSVSVRSLPGGEPANWEGDGGSIIFAFPAVRSRVSAMHLRIHHSSNNPLYSCRFYVNSAAI